jgi:hypothetical protein
MTTEFAFNRAKPAQETRQVALAHLLAEDRFPPDELWEEQLVSSRLLECEVWNRINAHQLQNSHGDAAHRL